LLGALEGSADCNPLNYLGGIQLNPCGLIANTMFNDVIKLTSGISSDGNVSLLMQETGIAWASDVQYLFAQPEGFNSEPCPGECDASCCEGDDWSCTTPYQVENGTCYRYFYPNDNTTQYLYEVSASKRV
jgi:hypothetical protein